MVAIHVRRSARILCAVLLPAAFNAAAAGTAVAAPAPLPPDATLVIPGHGWGHGRGMGQWGAKGMAAAGKTWSEILAHYYSGVSIATRAPQSIRALVEASPEVVVTADAPFTASWSDGTTIGSSDSAKTFARARFDGSDYLLERAGSSTGPWTLAARGARWIRFGPGTAKMQLVFNNGRVRYYRGSIIARYVSSDGMRAINELPLEQYLYGVVPRESPASWPADQLKAQAVAARTYAVYKQDGARSKGWMFDICSTTMCQVYGGYATKSSPSGSITYLESSASNAAVDATAGKVMLYQSKPILAEFSSSTGGYSAPSSLAYLAPVPDSTDAVSPHHEWTARVKVADVLKRWPEIGSLLDVVVTRRNGYGDMGGRVLEMRLVGTNATATVSGGSLRAAFPWPDRSDGVRSNWFGVKYWRGELVGTPDPVALPAGGLATVPVQIRNTGNTSWAVGGTVRLATPGDSRFAGDDWISSRRAASVAGNVTDPSRPSVAPGEVAEFRIPVHANGLAPGVYTERFTAIADGSSTMTPSFSVSVQVLSGWTDEVANLLANPSFEQGVSPWVGTNLTSTDTISRESPRAGAWAFQIAAGGEKVITQTIRLAGGSGRRFTLGGWNRTVGSSASGGPVELAATAAYADGTTDSWIVPFDRAVHAWSYAEDAFSTSAQKQVTSIKVSARLAGQTGTASFDAIRLVESPVTNGSFERGLAGWGSSGLTDGDGPTASLARDGTMSLKLAGAAGTKRMTQSIPISGARGERFVIGAWTRTEGTPASGGAITATLVLGNADGSTTSAPIAFSKDPHDWTYGEAVAVATKSFTGGAVALEVSDQTGTVWYDSLRVVRTAVANPSFELDLESWSPFKGFSSGDGVVPSISSDAARGLRLGGSGRQGVVQRLSTSGRAGRRVVFGGWNYATGTARDGGIIALKIAVRNVDGTLSWTTLRFPRTPHRWRYAERAYTARKDFRSVDIYALFYDQTGAAYFDAIGFRTDRLD